MLRVVSINVLLTYLAFGVFFTNPLTGERLSFSVTVMLTIIAADIAVAGAAGGGGHGRSTRAPHIGDASFLPFSLTILKWQGWRDGRARFARHASSRFHRRGSDPLASQR